MMYRVTNDTNDVQMKRRANNHYKLYSGIEFESVPLRQTFISPRPCAYKSAKIDKVTFYRGQGNKLSLAELDDPDLAQVYSRFSMDADISTVSGREITSIAKFNPFNR